MFTSRAGGFGAAWSRLSGGEWDDASGGSRSGFGHGRAAEMPPVGGMARRLRSALEDATAPSSCPTSGAEATRVFTVPKVFFKADPRDVRPVWHNHDGYSHQHAPRRGRHRLPSEDH